MIRSNLAKAIISVYKNEINDGTLWTFNVTLKVQVHMLCCKKKLICTICCVFLSVLYFNHVKTWKLLRLKSHNFVIFQGN